MVFQIEGIFLFLRQNHARRIRLHARVISSVGLPARRKVFLMGL